MNVILKCISPGILYGTLIFGLLFGLATVELFAIRLLGKEKRGIYALELAASVCCCMCFSVPPTLVLLLYKRARAIVSFPFYQGKFLPLCLVTVSASGLISVLVLLNRTSKSKNI